MLAWPEDLHVPEDEHRGTLFAMHNRMSFCRKCGAQLPADAQFCQRCGTPVPGPEPYDEPGEATQVDRATTIVAPPPPPPQRISVPPPGTRTAAAPPPVKKGGTGWWIVPLVIIGIVVIAWLLLAGLPFGRGEKKIAASTPAVETIGEGQAPAPGQSTGTVVEVAPDQTLTAAAPPNVSTAASPPVTQPEPQIIEERGSPAERPPATRPRPAPKPAPVQPRPAPVQPRPIPVPPRPAPREAPPPVETPTPQPAAEISESEASSTLRGYITSRNYYPDVAGGCVQVRGEGYKNVGYAFSAWDSCVSGGGTRMLGRWRVDAKTREVFRQQGSGRYQRP